MKYPLILNAFRWIVALFFLLNSLTQANISFFAGLFSLIIFIFISPKFTDLPSKIIKKPINSKNKFLIIIILFFLTIAFSKKISSSTTSISPAPTITIAPIPTITSTATPIPTTTIEISPTNVEISNLPTENISEDKTLYSVVKVIDGDTVVVSIDGKNETLRLIGIDTPEMVDPRKPVQCFAKEASEKAKNTLTGQKVRLESDQTQGDKDRYNRLLRYIYLADGTSFNKMMIEQGFAHEYTYNLPYKYRDEYITAEKNANTNNLGLWAPDACPIVTSIEKKTVEATPSPVTNSGNWKCDCNKVCSKMDGCAEAMYQLKTCGCTARDADSDGIPCESLCR